ncbi:glycosyltransferase [Actinobacillus equuli]|uniref:glycosyltransferase n=1 Tax=Actinobacillus equuli TaxID=718 RepID=UPI0024417DD3|nr:glycosyltransferase [Actinobacillus equuli]WGE65244.1 glycosyltransferase [Actinobacillus equuli subsp. equuli]WGE79226.1 glycosyltransferase [Actinobacillus equuli subsp. equuli]
MKSIISIIVPVYNVSFYLKRCIDSLLQQTYTNLEIILVNDGSTDDSGKICDNYKIIDDRIKVIHKENGGLSSARNIGIASASGEYIGFVDSDDWVTPDMFEYLYFILRQNNADISVSSCMRCNSIEEGENLILKNKTHTITVCSQEEYMKKFMKIDSQTIEYYACNKLYKRELLTNEQYPIGKTAEDVLGTFKALLKARKVVLSDKITYFYYINPNSITASFSIKKANDLLSVWESVVELSKGNDIYYNWANINKARIDFTILFKIAIARNYKELIRNTDFIISLQERLLKNKNKLLDTNISLSRKIMIRAFCLNYYLSANLLNVIRNFFRTY